MTLEEIQKEVEQLPMGEKVALAKTLPLSMLPEQSSTVSGWINQNVLSRLFKTLVVISAVTYLLWFFEMQLTAGWLSEETLNLLDWSGYGALLEFPPSFWWLVMLIEMAVRMGLYLYSSAARITFSIFLGFISLSSLITGVSISTGFGTALGAIGWLAEGAILILAYLSPLRARFR